MAASTNGTPTINRWHWPAGYTWGWAIVKAFISYTVLLGDIIGSILCFGMVGFFLYDSPTLAYRATVWTVAAILAIGVWVSAQSALFEAGSGYDETKQARLTNNTVLGQLVQKSPIGIMATAIHGSGNAMGITCMIVSPLSDSVLIFLFFAPGFSQATGMILFLKVILDLAISLVGGIFVFYFAGRGPLRTAHMFDHAKRSRKQDRIWEQQEEQALAASAKKGGLVP